MVTGLIDELRLLKAPVCHISDFTGVHLIPSAGAVMSSIEKETNNNTLVNRNIMKAFSALLKDADASEGRLLLL